MHRAGVKSRALDGQLVSGCSSQRVQHAAACSFSSTAASLARRTGFIESPWGSAGSRPMFSEREHDEAEQGPLYRRCTTVFGDERARRAISVWTNRAAVTATLALKPSTRWHLRHIPYSSSLFHLHTKTGPYKPKAFPSTTSFLFLARTAAAPSSLHREPRYHSRLACRPRHSAPSVDCLPCCACSFTFA